MEPILYVVIPCYNEEQVLPVTAPLFLGELQLLIKKRKIHPNSRILFVNDGSGDQTAKIIADLTRQNAHFCGLCLSRNRGHQNALLAGLMEAKDRCDITISVDCDGQDDITAMEAMVDAYRGGSEVVYGVRSKRETDTFFKRFTAESFYKLLNAMGAETVYNHADYRLISARVLHEFAEFREVHLFLRGLIPLVGFPSSTVYYERRERLAGKSHYPLKKMLALAIDGITGLSIKPLRFITLLGALTALAGLIGVAVSLIMRAGIWPPVLCFVAGLQILCLGVLGAYIGRTYMEVKHRPRYIIQERIGDFDAK